MVTQTGDPLRRKALTCIREGRVRIRFCALGDKPHIVKAWVRSSRDGHLYNVKYDASANLVPAKWSCDCREGRRDLPCAHTLAVALVTTGLPS